MQFLKVADFLTRLEAESSRLEITSILAELLQHLDTDEIPPALYLVQGSLTPAYVSLEFNLSTKSVLKVLARIIAEHFDIVSSNMLFEELDADRSLEQVTQWYKELGDIGATAQKVLEYTDEHGSTLRVVRTHSIDSIHRELISIARSSGAGSQEHKQTLLATLVSSLTPLEARYVSRIVVGKLRLGFSHKTIIDALSWAVHGDKRDRELIETAYQHQADIGVIAREYLAAQSQDDRHSALNAIDATVGIPLVPALCQRLNTAAEIIEKMSDVFVEPKYDGLRVQIHVSSEGTRVFSRSLEEISHMFPEVMELPKQLGVQSVILDAEVIGWDFEEDQALPFQETIRRKRKHDVAATANAVPVRFFVFDLLYCDGESLLHRPLTDRRALLQDVLTPSELAVVTEAVRTDDPEKVHRLHEEYLAEGLEGAVIKQATSVYQSGRKGWSWVKIKEAEGTTGKLVDTIDAVVMGYYRGRGKRAQFGLGALLVGVREGESEQIRSIAKIGTGLTEALLVELKANLDEIQSQAQPEIYQVIKEVYPDVWTEPRLVVEVAADELTNSSIHTAGIALRFPRLVRIRADKNLEGVTTLAEAQEIKRLSESSR